MDPFIPSLHEYLKKNLRKQMQPRGGGLVGPKRYMRMEAVPLPGPEPLDISLRAALAQRASRKKFGASPLPLKKLASLLYHAAHKSERAQKRPYPSGGGLYPIELYVLSFSIEQLPNCVLHYEPDSHTLRRLWPISPDVQLASIAKLGQERPSALIVLTSVWQRSMQKYRDFAYILSLLEAGHLSQNILLCAESISLAACPLGAFNDELVGDLLEIDKTIEQSVHAITLANILKE